MTLIPARQLQTGNPVGIGTANSPGSADSVVKSDHVHAHGAQTDQTLHAGATQSLAGFMSAADKVILDAMTSAVKLECRYVSVTNIANILTGAPNTVDGNSVAAGNRILVVGQTTTAENGIYIVSSVGTGADGVWARATDADTAGKLQTGILVYIYAGATYAFTLWALGNQAAVYTGKMVGGPMGNTSIQSIANAGSVGTSVLPARNDHTHGHGSQTTGTHHAAVTSSVNGFMSAADKVILDSHSSAVKAVCRSVTVTNIADLAAGAPLSIDSNNTVVGARILVAGQTTKSQNGIYTVSSTGSGSDGAWVRATDADTLAKLQTGVVVFVAFGGTYGPSLWVISDQPLQYTVSLIAGAGALTDALHGSLGGGSDHALVTTSVAGFMSASDKTKLNGITALADPTLTTLAAAASNISVNSKNITNLADPAGAQDAATKAYVDAVANGLDVKASVRCASPSAVSYNPNSTAPNIVDGVTLVVGDRVLVKDHSGTLNGIWVVGTVGTGANGVWSRATDADTNVKVTPGLFTFVQEGTVNADTGWVCTNDTTINLAVTVLTFAKFSSFALATVAPVDAQVQTAAVGTSSKAAREDHAHNVATGTPSAIGTANAAGSAATLVRSDHVHDHGAQTTSTHHAVAVASGANGFLSGADKAKLDGITALADPTIATLAAASAAISVNSQRIISLADPTGSQDAATKAYVDLRIKQPVRAVATTNITRSGTQTIDGVALNVGDRVLEAFGLNTFNGIYTVAAGTWPRSTDADVSAEVNGGMFVFATEGTVNAGTGWVLATADPIVLGTTNLQFNKFTTVALATAAAQDVQVQTATTGASTNAAKEDHKHNLATGTPVAIGTANAAGSAATSVRSDHVHDHGAQTVGTLHAAATQSVAGFLSAADKIILDSMTASVKKYVKGVVVTNIATLAGGTPSTVDGTSLSVNDRLLLTAQTTTSQNGIYKVTTVGTGADGTWAKDTDADTTAKVQTGVLVYCSAGTIYQRTLWVVSDQSAQFVVRQLGGQFNNGSTSNLSNVSDNGTSVMYARGDHVHGHGNMATSASLYHALAVAGGNPGFLAGADKTKLDSLAASQAATLGYVTVDVLLETPSAPAYSASLNLDTSTKNDFAIGVLTGNLAITLTNPAAGRQGTIWVKQDATGSRTVSFTVSGYTVVKDTLAPDLNPQAGANTLTQYSYSMFTIGGTNYCQVAKSFLS